MEQLLAGFLVVLGVGVNDRADGHLSAGKPKKKQTCRTGKNRGKDRKRKKVNKWQTDNPFTLGELCLCLNISDIQSLSPCEPIWSHNRPEGGLGHRWCPAAAMGLYTQTHTNAHSLNTLSHTHMPSDCMYISVYSACQHNCVKGRLVDGTTGMQMHGTACTHTYGAHTIG